MMCLSFVKLLYFQRIGTNDSHAYLYIPNKCCAAQNYLVRYVVVSMYTYATHIVDVFMALSNDNKYVVPTTFICDLVSIDFQIVNVVHCFEYVQAEFKIIFDYMRRAQCAVSIWHTIYQQFALSRARTYMQ